MPRCAALALVLTLVPLARAQEPPALDAPAAPRDAARDAAARKAHLDVLEKTTVHFEFGRAPLSDVARALERATSVPVTIGAKAREALARRKFKMKYVASRTGLQVLEDVSKAAALDWEVTGEGAVLDLPAALQELRKELGLPARKRLLTPQDVEKLLDGKKIDLTARDRTLEDVLEFLRRETGIGFVHLSEEGAPPPGRVDLSTGEVKLREVLDRLCEKLGLAWGRQGNVIVLGREDAVRPRPAPVEPAEEEPEDE